MKSVLSIIIIIIFLVIRSNAQDSWTFYKIKSIPITGISFCIQSDYSGGIYLGLSGGLAYFNGSEWKRIYYNVNDPNNHYHQHNIRTVKIFNNIIWAGTNNGLIKICNDSIFHYNPDNTPTMCDDKIRGITPDQYGNIWFLNHCLGIFKFDVLADSVVISNVPITTPLPFISDANMFYDNMDNIWYSIDKNFVKYSNGIVKIIDSTEIPDFKNDEVKTIHIMKDNSIAIAMKSNIGIYKDYNDIITYNKIDIPENFLETDESFYLIKVDSEGNLWVLSRYSVGDGISSRHFYKYSKEGVWEKYHFPLFEGTNDSIYALTDFTIDEKGKVWFIDPYYGVFVFNPNLSNIDSQLNYSSVVISPNPVESTLYIKCNNNNIKNIEIYSTIGIKMLQSDYQESIDVSSLPSGIYYLKLKDFIGKFIKL